MAYFFLIIALIIAGLMVPKKYFGPAGAFLPDEARVRRRLQWGLVGALTMALLSLKLLPVAALVALVGGGMTALGGWRDKMLGDKGLGNLDEEPDINASNAPPPAMPGQMSASEAREVLGVSDEAEQDEIEKVHRRLIGQIHPDKGGSNYLAAKINQARDILLDK